MAASVAWALEQLPELEQDEIKAGGRGKDGRLLLWIVGAREAMEGELIRNGYFAEPLSKLCPPHLSPLGLEVVLIGPEMKQWELELPASPRPPVIARALSGTLHVAADARASRPNAIVLFNSGIGTLIWPLVEAWLPSIAAMLILDVPILCTCFNNREASGEEMVLGQQAFETATLMPSRKNPLAYVAPLEVIAAGNGGMSEEEAAQVTAVAASEAAAEEEAAEAIAAAKAAAEAQKTLADSTKAAVTSALQPQPAAAEPTAEPSVAIDSGAPTICNHYVKWVRGSALPEDELHGSAQHKAAEVNSRGHSNNGRGCC